MPIRNLQPLSWFKAAPQVRRAMPAVQGAFYPIWGADEWLRKREAGNRVAGGEKLPFVGLEA